MSSKEHAQRRDLAAAYRLAAHRGWDDIVWTHISATVPDAPNAYLINRFGLRFNEITASNLVKVDVKGNVIDGSNAPVNPSGFAIHGCVHRARADAACVLHLHSFWAQAFAASGQDLLPCSQPAMRLYRRLGRHAYEGLAFNADEQSRLVTALDNLDGLILEQHGILLVGRTVAEAFVLMHLFERAARIQLTLSAGAGRVATTTDAIAEKTYQQWIGNGQTPEGLDEWPALLRGLDQTDPDYQN
ncbi:MAG: class II aldolase/adducin family protein [Burkholderiaceae bacterium]|nr:class II aldolase/adducin family protein [Burkholderiaceae bacterium]